MCALPTMSQNHMSMHMDLVRHMFTMEVHVLGIVSSHKILCPCHFLRLFGVIPTMLHFPFVFLLGAGCWAKPPAEDGTGQPKNLRTSSGIEVLMQTFVRGLGFGDLSFIWYAGADTNVCSRFRVCGWNIASAFLVVFRLDLLVILDP